MKSQNPFQELSPDTKEKGPVGSKVLERNVCVSNSEIKAEKEQLDNEDSFLASL